MKESDAWTPEELASIPDSRLFTSRRRRAEEKAAALADRVAELELLRAEWPLRATVIVSLNTGPGFKGILWETGPSLMLLRNVEMIGDGGLRTPVDGEVIVERDKVEYVQVLRR